MNTYYCHTCMSKLGLYSPSAEPVSLNLTGSKYLLRKFIKHTVPSSGSFKKQNSIYSDPTYEAYQNYYVSGSASGSLEVQPNGQKNLIWYAGTPLGPSFKNGSFDFCGDAVKIVYPENTGLLHHYHVDATKYQTAVCANCGGPVLI